MAAYDFRTVIGADWSLPKQARLGPAIRTRRIFNESSGYSILAKDGGTDVNPALWKDYPHRSFVNLPVVTLADSRKEMIDPKAMLSFTKRYGLLDNLLTFEEDKEWTEFLESEGLLDYLKEKEDRLMVVESSPSPDTISKEIVGYSSEQIRKLVHTQSLLKYAWRSGDERALDAIDNYLSSGLPIHFDIDEGCFHIYVVNVQRLILMLFLRDHAEGKTAICANPDCPAPYFLKSRKTQKICEAGGCVTWAQRNYALKWWRENESKASKKNKKGTAK